jgi:N4-gp56 family major capsid protein
MASEYLTTSDLKSLLTVLTKEVLVRMMPLLRYTEFVTYRTDLAVTPGKSITFRKWNLVKGPADLTEGSDLEVGKPQEDTVEISVKEYGKGFGVTELSIRQATYDLVGEVSTLLALSASWALNQKIAETVTFGENVIYAGGKSGRADLTDSDVLTTKEIKDAVEFLNSNNVPRFTSATPLAGVTDYYIGFATPHQLRALRDDDKWISASLYGAPGQIFAGEVGMYEKVRFIETTMQPVIDTDGKIYYDGVECGTTESPGTVPVHCAVIFGMNYVGWAEALPVEVRDNGIKDFGRKREFAWYAIWGFGRIDEVYGIRIETA